MTINLSCLIPETTRIQKQVPLFVFIFIDSLVVSTLQHAEIKNNDKGYAFVPWEGAGGGKGEVYFGDVQMVNAVIEKQRGFVYSPQSH